ncbi:hypothetical protein PHYBLDRAFT_60652, partial [Phycomyces blakesleeanus NRRL 1555(-)]
CIDVYTSICECVILFTNTVHQRARLDIRLIQPDNYPAITQPPHFIVLLKYLVGIYTLVVVYFTFTFRKWDFVYKEKPYPPLLVFSSVKCYIGAFSNAILNNWNDISLKDALLSLIAIGLIYCSLFFKAFLTECAYSKILYYSISPRCLGKAYLSYIVMDRILYVLDVILHIGFVRQ